MTPNPDYLTPTERRSYWTGEWLGGVIENRPDLQASRTESDPYSQEVPTPWLESSSPPSSSEQP